MVKTIEQIKVEIERLKESGCASPIVICDTLLAFIDSLQEKPVSEDLMQASVEFLKALARSPYNNTPVTNAQTVVKELVRFLNNPSEYDPNHIDGARRKSSVDDDFEKLLAECIREAQCSVVDPLAHAQSWKDGLLKVAGGESRSDSDLEEEIVRYIGYPEEVDEDVSTTMIRKAARHFANWRQEQIMKGFPAWKKSKKLIEGALLDRGILYIPRYMIELSELKKLPKVE